MPTPRISASGYSNTAPLVWSFIYGANLGKYELILDNAPARSAQLLAEKRIDAALVPVIEYQRIDDVLLVPDVCVGATERVRSVCLVTKGAELADLGKVALDTSSRTSVALTKIIFREFLGRDPQFRAAGPNIDAMLESNDAALLIGDPALMLNDGDVTASGITIRKFDLAEIWRSFTGFGFVFAMWMAHRDKTDVARRVGFAAARDEGLSHLDEIISNYEHQIPLARDDFRDYLASNITYTVNESMLRGLGLFFELAHRHKLTERCAPMEYL